VKVDDGFWIVKIRMRGGGMAKSERRTPILKALKEESASTCWALGVPEEAGPGRSLVGKGKNLLWGYKYAACVRLHPVGWG
jgi:hypothetical protein